MTPGRRVLLGACRALDRLAPWHRLPRALGLVGLLGIRVELRARNLYDPAPPPPGSPPAPAGGAGRPFGRNQPLWAMPSRDPEDLLEPSPRVVSERLLARHGRFRGVPFLNMLAAAWLQFMVHDWMSHGPGVPGQEIRIPLEPGDRWEARSPGGEMLVRSTPRSADPAAPAGAPVFDNTETAWWDGSQLYGSTPEREAQVREGAGGRLMIGPDGLLPVEERAGVDLTGVNGNWWLGLGVMHTLFAREHNAVAAMLADRNPGWDDDRLFAVARRITAGVMAKIHTIEWTPAILPHPTVRRAMHGNWHGVFGPRAARRLRRFTRSDLLIGIPGSRCDDHGVPYSLTEEFVGVYRMHPLIPDRLALREDGAWTEVGMADVTGPAGRAAMERLGLPGAIVSLGHVRPGLLALHNYPDTLRDLERPTAGSGSERRIDLAAVDIVRDRERGLPRYNDFRRMVRMRPAATFEELTGGDRAAAAELRDVYGDVERVDLMVGLYAEPLLPGFGFSETAFRIFVLMASRRLKSDPRYTDEWDEEHLTPEGMRWVEEATMASVIRRNVPELAPAVDALPGGPFAPWGPDPMIPAPEPAAARSRSAVHLDAEPVA